MIGGRDRGATSTLSYVLTLAITVTLTSGLLIAAGGMVDDRRESAARNELRVIGQQMDSRLAAADRLVEGGASEVRITASAPRSVAGSTYTVSLVDGNPPQLRLNATGPDVHVSVTVALRTPVTESSVPGGDVLIVYTDGKLEVRAP